MRYFSNRSHTCGVQRERVEKCTATLVLWAVLVIGLVVPDFALAAVSASEKVSSWTLSTDDTMLTLSLEDGRPALRVLRSKLGNDNWLHGSPKEELMETVEVNGSAVNDCTDFTRLLRTRTEGKASITVVRDRKEQNLTLTLPEPRRSGSIGQRKCEDLDEEACAEVIEESNEVAAMVPEIMTAEIKRIQPEMERAKKQIQEEILNHRDELKKEMDNLQQELREQQEELKQEMKQWVREADI